MGSCLHWRQGFGSLYYLSRDLSRWLGNFPLLWEDLLGLLLGWWWLDSLSRSLSNFHLLWLLLAYFLSSCFLLLNLWDWSSNGLLSLFLFLLSLRLVFFDFLGSRFLNLFVLFHFYFHIFLILGLKYTPVFPIGTLQQIFSSHLNKGFWGFGDRNLVA